LQRTTGTAVGSWVANHFTPAHDHLVNALTPLVKKGGADLGDVGLGKKLGAITQQLNGHVHEVAYGASKIATRGAGTAFGAYPLGGKTYGADVTAARRGAPR
jgi:hypothetical protein